MIFTRFPEITYCNKQMTDITIRLKMVDLVKSNVSFAEPYYIEDNETIEDLSYKVYGSVNHYWVIALLNDVIDPVYDWVLNVEELREYVENKYGVGNDIQIHHWELDGDIVPPFTLGAVAYTNFEYEERENEKKREIKMIRPEYLPQLLNEAEDFIESL